MKTAYSRYIEKVTPELKELLGELLKEYAYVSILAVDSKSRGYSVASTGMSISESDFLSTRGFTVRVYDGTRYGEYSFNDLSGVTAAELSRRISESLKPLETCAADIGSGRSYPMMPDESLTLEKSTEYKLHPDEMGDEEIIKRLTQVREKGMARDERILDMRAFFSYREMTKLFLSKNRELKQSILWSTGGIMALAARGEEVKDCYKGYSCLGGAEVLEDMLGDADNVADTVIALLDSQPMVPGEYECVCAPDVTGMIVHEAFGHGVEMDMFVKKRAQAEQFIGQYVASPLVTMRDGAAAADETASFFFDDEGTLAGDTLIIDKGVLKGGICDAMSAMCLDTAPTGNGRRESYARKAYTRMTNTFFTAGTDRTEDMIASVKYGFLLENASSGMEDPKNWGIQCMVSIAREIKDGKLTGKLFSPVVLTGYVPDLLKSITMMSEQVVLAGGGYCGKGHKEWVKVSDGGPYIKAKIRLG